jgi:hypothetical protein
MNRDKIGTMRAGLVFASSRQTPRQIGLDPPALVAIKAERLLMAIRAIVPRPLRQQPVLLHKKSAVIVNHTRTAVAILTFIGLATFEAPVVGPGERETDEHKHKGRGQHDYFKRLIGNHGLPPHVQ